MARIIYLTFENVCLHGLIQAMVIEPMKKMNDIDFVLFSFERKNDHKNELYVQHLANINSASNIELKIFKKSMGNKQSLLRFIIDILRAMPVILKECRNSDKIHVRSYGPMLLAIVSKYLFKKKVIFDVRGMLPEETLEVNGHKRNGIKFKLLKRYERFIFKHCDDIISVSHKMAELIALEYSRESLVIPNPAMSNQDSAASNREYDLVYAGSNQEWHCPDLTLELLQGYLELYGSRKCLIISNLPEFWRSRINPLYHERLTVVSASQSDVSGYLSRAKIGICLIRNSFAKSVCMPVKFNEYVAAGCKVVVNENIGDLTDLVTTHELGLSVNLESQTFILKQLLQDLNEICNTYMPVEIPKTLRSDNYLITYRNLYKTL